MAKVHVREKLCAALFVLAPSVAADGSADALAAASPAGATLRRYPRADGPAHAASLVRDGRDPIATRWRAGFVRAVVLGAVLGGAVNGVLAGAFDLFGGLVGIAAPLGLALGAFLGAFTAAMTGTQVARPELRPLLARTRPGDVLLQWNAPDAAPLRALADACDRAGLASVLLDA